MLKSVNGCGGDNGKRLVFGGGGGVGGSEVVVGMRVVEEGQSAVRCGCWMG